MCDEIRKLLSTCWPGIFGALVSLYYTKPLCLFKGLVSFCGGAVAAVALAPAFASHAGDHVVSGASFLIGTFSMSILGIVFQVIDRVRAAPIHSIGEFVGVVIDVLLAFRHGRTRGDKESKHGNEIDS